MTLPRLLGLAALATCVLASSPASAGEVAPGATATEPDEPAPPTLMRILAGRGLHDLDDERWNAYGQVTYISSWKRSFPAPYTNLGGSPNSLLPDAERSFTASATLFLGLRL